MLPPAEIFPKNFSRNFWNSQSTGMLVSVEIFPKNFPENFGLLIFLQLFGMMMKMMIRRVRQYSRYVGSRENFSNFFSRNFWKGQSLRNEIVMNCNERNRKLSLELTMMKMMICRKVSIEKSLSKSLYRKVSIEKSLSAEVSIYYSIRTT